MREDIYGGLKNALERGTSIEQAVKSLINSGYPAREVNAAAQQLTSGALATADPSTNPSIPKLRDLARTQQKKPEPIEITQKPMSQYKPLTAQQTKPLTLPKNQNSKSTRRIIVLIIILLILITGLILTIIFREKLVNFLTNIF